MGDNKLKMEASFARICNICTFGSASMQAKRMNPKPMITPDIQQMPLHALVGPTVLGASFLEPFPSFEKQGKRGSATRGVQKHTFAQFESLESCAELCESCEVELAAAQAFQALDTDRALFQSSVSIPTHFFVWPRSSGPWD